MEDRPYFLDRSLLKLGHDMAIQIERDLRLAMTEPERNRLNIDASYQRERRRGVTEAMKLDGWYPGFLEELREFTHADASHWERVAEVRASAR